MTNFVLITGGSGGIGLELANLFWADGYNLCIASLDEPCLHEMHTRLPERPEQTLVRFPINLSEPGSGQALYDAVREKGISPEFLVNCAGFGDWGELVDADPGRIEGMVRLNVETTTTLCLLFGQDMKARKRGGILNVGSTIAFQPLPFMAAYSACKHYVLSFSEALTEELRPYGVKVSCLCPGTTATSFLDSAGIERSTKKGSLGQVAHAVAMNPKEVALVGYRGLSEERPLIIPGALNRFHYLTTRLLPNRLMTAIAQNLMVRSATRESVPGKGN